MMKPKRQKRKIIEQEASIMVKSIHGVVHGKTIELKDDPGLTDGQEIEITVRVIHPREKWGEGILRCAGAMAPHWTKEDDRILEEIYRDRQRPSSREIPE
jgi:hypothetical protein